jgi:signal transduction histidine kinase
MLTTAYANNERQIQVVHDLLNVARVDAGDVRLQRERTDLRKLVREVLASQALLFAEHGHRTRVKAAKGDFHALIDPGKFRMVLENLTNNACKYSHPGSKIEIRLEQDATHHYIHVYDEGVGIAKQDIRKLFKKFSRIDNPLAVEAAGTGLGLYWAKKIMQLHGGTITVESIPDQTTTFTISLPKTT